MSATPTRYGAAYLASAWWAELRAAYERHPSAPHSCAVCATPRYQLHHRTYENLGHEHISDLIALCSVHHHALHRSWLTHHAGHPDDTLAGFTDAWVLIQRRRYRNAPLPALDLYLPRSTSRTATAANQTTAASTRAPVIESTR